MNQDTTINTINNNNDDDIFANINLDDLINHHQNHKRKNNEINQNNNNNNIDHDNNANDSSVKQQKIECCYLEKKAKWNGKLLNNIKDFEQSQFIASLTIEQQQKLVFEYYKFKLPIRDYEVLTLTSDIVWKHITSHMKPYSLDPKAKQAEQEQLKEEHDMIVHHHKKFIPYLGPTMRYNGYVVPARCKVDPLKLAHDNAHPRDKEVIFDEDPHLYYLKGRLVSISVTGLLHFQFSEFIEKETIHKMLRNNGRTFPYKPKHKKYHTLPIWCMRESPMSNVKHNIDVWQEGADFRSIEIAEREISKCWAAIRDEASSAGTQMHMACEYYCNGEDLKDDSIEFQYFLNFFNKVKADGYVPYRSEQVLWVEEMDLSGSVDIQFSQIDPVTGKKKYYLKDWKRSKEINFSNQFQKGIDLMQEYDDCNYVHYTLQLNIYKFIIEKYYDIKFESMSILVFHPNQKDYVEIFVEDKQHIIQEIYNRRVELITRIKNRYDHSHTFVSMVYYAKDIECYKNYKKHDKYKFDKYQIGMIWDEDNHVIDIKDPIYKPFTKILELDEKNNIIKAYDVEGFYAPMMILLDDDQQSREILENLFEILNTDKRQTIFPEYTGFSMSVNDVVHLSASLWITADFGFSKLQPTDKPNEWRYNKNN